MCKYVILSYLSRSGSTFLSNKLNNYKDICVTLEASFPPELLGIQGYNTVIIKSDTELNQFISDVNQLSKVRNWKLDNQHLIERIKVNSFPISGIKIFKAYLDCFREKYKPDANLVIYKGSPVMPWTIPQVLFNDSGLQVVYLQRDPRAIYSSQKNNKLPYANSTFTNSPFQVGLDWNHSCQALKTNDSSRVFKIKYEDLITSDKYVDEIVSWLGVESKKDNLSISYSQLIPEEEQSIHSEIQSSGKMNYVHKWKNIISTSEKQAIDWLCGYNLAKEGYDAIEQSRSVNLKYAFLIYQLMSKLSKKVLFLRKTLRRPLLYMRRLKNRV